VIKELAPIKGAETDEILGVNEFHTKYFLDHPLYLDSERAFYSALGIDLIHSSYAIANIYFEVLSVIVILGFKAVNSGENAKIYSHSLSLHI
jgi:hypothetical protein